MQRTPATIALTALTGALTVIAVALVGVDTTAATPHTLVPNDTFTTGPLPIHPPPVTFAAYGDSITAGWAPMNSWTVYVISHQVQFDSGSFQVGLRSDQIVDSAIARGIPNVRAMVVMGCTNDIGQGVDWHNCLTNWDRLAAAAPTVKVIVAAIAPSNVPAWAAAILDYNAALRVHAYQMGWTFVDPYAPIRADDGSFLPGYQRDPVNDPTHPNNAAQQLAAGILTSAILAQGGTRSGH